MMGPDWLCVHCSQSIASSFCACEEQETFLCEGCVQQHCSKNTRLVHIAVPVSAYGQHRISGYFERLQPRLTQHERAKTELLKNIEAVDKCFRELTAEIQSVIDAVWNYGQMQLTRLQQIKEEFNQEINNAIKEVEKTMYDDSPILTHPLAMEVRKYSGDSKTLNLFSFQVNASTVISAIASICRFSRISAVDQIAGIFQNQLRVYNLPEDSNQMFILSKHFADDVSICFLSWTTLLCVGSTPPSTEATLINFANVQSVEVLATSPLLHPRASPGVICVSSFPYVFGSIPASKMCEQYDTAKKKWRRLPDMKYDRGAFTPATFQSEIYLVSARHPIEVFHIDLETIRVLSLSSSGDSNDCSALFINDELYIFKKNIMGRWKLGADEITYSSYESKEKRAFSQCPPVYYQSNVYFIDWKTGLVNMLNLDTMIGTW